LAHHVEAPWLMPYGRALFRSGIRRGTRQPPAEVGGSDAKKRRGPPAICRSRPADAQL